jgi:hypothetical protein
MKKAMLAVVITGTGGLAITAIATAYNVSAGCIFVWGMFTGIMVMAIVETAHNDRLN